MGVSEFNDYLDELNDQNNRQSAVAASLRQAHGVNPDERVKLQKLGSQSKIPVEWLADDEDMRRDAERRAFVQSHDPERLVRENPATADLLSDPETAKVLWDDAQGLAHVEDVFKLRPVNTMGIASPNDRRAASRAKSIGGALWEGIKASPELTNQALARTGQAVAEFTDWTLQAFPDDTGMRKRVSEIAKDSADYWKRAAKAKMGTYAPGTAESYVQQAGSSIGTSLLAAPFGMGGQNAALAMFGLFADGGYQEMRDAGYNPLAAGVVDVSSRIMEGLTEKIGLDRIYKGGDDILKTAIRFTLGDLGGEEINTIYNAISDKVTIKPDMTWGDLAQQVVDTAIVTGIAGPLQGASMTGAARVSESLYAAYERQNAIKQQTDFLTALGDTVKSTKSFERLPEKVQELVKRLKEQAGGAVDNVYIPADRWSMLWQDANVDPGDMAEEILGDRQQYQEALAANSDIVIPLENFTKLAGTDNYGEILQDVRLNPGEMTPREHEEWAQNMGAEVERILSEAQGEDGAATPDRQVYDDVLGQLIAIGTERGTAEKQAALWQATMRTLAARTGTDAMSLFRQYAPTITRPLPDVLAKRVSVDMQIDPLLDRLRAGDMGAKEAEIFGPSLIEFIRSKGGLKDSGGELKSRDVKGGIIRKNGMEFDRARESAVEAGYLPEESTISDFLDALDAELRGNPRYSPGNQNSNLLEERETLQQFRDFLDQNGIDLEGMGNEEIRKVLGQGAAQGDFVYQYPVISPEDAQRAKRQVLMEMLTVQPDSDRATQLEIMAQQYDAIISGDATYADFQPGALFQDGQSPRGFFDLNSNTIGLLEGADLSTFLHESSHFFWTVLKDLATRPDAPQQIKDDYQTLLAWFGTDNPQREHLEQFARGFEQYLGEGKAPTPELQSLFNRFKAWMMQVYKSLKNLNVDLTDEVRGVFDRMIATDEELKAARDNVGAKPIFATAEDAGMTDAEFAAYQATAAEAGQRENERLTAQMMKEFKREQEKWWKERRAEVRKEVEAEAKGNPVYEAIQILSTGTMFDGTEHPAGPMKLDKDELIRRYGKEFLKRLPRGFHHIYTTDGGTSIDLIAEAFGFDSGDAMLQQMIEAPKMKDWIESETDIRMRKEHGDKLTDGSIVEDAMATVHNDDRAKVLRAELAAIRKKQREVKPYVDAAKDQAKEEQRRRQKEMEYERRWLDAENNLRMAIERGEMQSEIDRLRKEAKSADAMLKVARRDMYAGIPPVEAFKSAAILAIGQRKIFELDPYAYARAEQKAAREAFDAATRGDYATAGEAKQRQILNHYLYREAKAAKDDAEKILQKVKKTQSKSGQERLAKAGESFLEQMNRLLERYQFQRTSNAELSRRESLREWAARMEEEGLIIPIDDDVLDAATVINYRQATVDELRAFYDALRVIESAAKQYREFRTANDLLEWEDVKDDLIESILKGDWKSTKELGRPNDKMKLSKSAVRAKGAAAWRWFDAEHLKMEQMIEWLDGGRIDGPWARYFFDAADHAQTKEYDFHARITKALQDLNDSMPKDWHGSMLDDTRATLKGIDGAVNRYTLISIAMNTGNDGNLQRLLDGNRWTEDELDAAMAELTAEDWKYIQGVWDVIDSLWPEIEALQKRVAGLPPKKVEAREINNQHGTFRGGYFPLVYDPKTSDVGEKQASAGEDVAGFLQMHYGKAATSKGHTKERMETVNARPLLDFEKVVARHMGKVIKDLSHREAVFNLNRILKSKEIKALLVDRVGEKYYRQMKAWLQTLISDRADALGQEVTLIPRMARGLRTNTAIVTMGFKIATALSQFAGFGPSVDLVGYRNLTKAMIKVMANPRKVWAEISEKSGEMRHRANTVDRDMKEELMKLRGVQGKVATVKRTAFILTAMADRIVSAPTWLAGYSKALGEGLTEADAIRAGDRAVRLSQGAGGAKDLAAVQREHELMKLLTMYYTPFSALYSRLRDVGHTTKAPRDLPRAIARSIALVILPAVLGDLLAGRGPDDDEDPVWWAARKAMMYPFQIVPVVRDLANATLDPWLAGKFDGSVKWKPSYKISPLEDAVLKTIRAIGNIDDAWDGNKPWDDTAWDMFEASGYLFGLPTAQARITGEYLEDMLTNGTNDDNLSGIVFRRHK